MNRKQKGILIAFACMLVFAIVGSIVMFGDVKLSLPFGEREEEEKPNSFYFHPADYAENILEEEAYLELDRSIRLADGGVMTILEEPFSQYDEAVSLLANYLQAAIHGDSEALNACFTEDYKEQHGEKGSFPMQRLYDMVIEKDGEYALTTGEYAGMTRYLYRVRYQIRQNDGRFDNGIPSDAYKVRIFELLGDINGVLINSITDYRIG